MEAKQTTVRRGKELINLNGTQKIMADSVTMRDGRSKSTESTGGDSIDSDCLTLWQHPIITLNYFIRELLIDLASLAQRTLRYRKTVWSVGLLIGLFFVLRHVAGPHQKVINLKYLTI